MIIECAGMCMCRSLSSFECVRVYFYERRNEIFSFGGWLLASSVEHMKCKTKNARKLVLEKSIYQV